MTNEELLRQAISNSGLKMSFISQQIGLSYQGLLNKIQNKNEFNASEIRKISELLKITNEQRDKIFFAQ